jgi:hypothetical protein
MVVDAGGSVLFVEEDWLAAVLGEAPSAEVVAKFGCSLSLFVDAHVLLVGGQGGKHPTGSVQACVPRQLRRRPPQRA